MRHKTIHIIPWLCILMPAMLMMVACQQDDDIDSLANGRGTIRLALTNAELYTELLTRGESAVGDLTHYAFTLNGTTIGGAAVTDLLLTIDADGTTEVSAGTYTLTAENSAYANLDYGHPYYKGTSEPFTIDINETKAVGIALGKPQNARVAFTLDDTFTALYEAPTVVLSDGNRSITLTSPDESCYFIIPADGTLAYTITATAKAGSHVSDMITATGYIEIASGYNTTIRLQANPATGIIIPVISGEHSGTFD